MDTAEQQIASELGVVRRPMLHYSIRAQVILICFGTSGHVTLEGTSFAVRQRPCQQLHNALSQAVLELEDVAHRELTCIRPNHCASAKGLEFRAFHILAAEGLKKFPMHRELTFIRVTRAKTSLCIYHSADLPSYLEGALSKLNPDTPVVGLDALLEADEEDEN